MEINIKNIFEKVRPLMEHKPYTYEYTFALNWYFAFYKIYFDGDFICATTSKKDAKEMVNLLNGAYLMGISSVISNFNLE